MSSIARSSAERRPSNEVSTGAAEPASAAGCPRRAALVGIGVLPVLVACGGSADMTPAGFQVVVPFARFAALQSVGGSVVTEVDNQGKTVLLVVIRTGATTAAALSASCTHMGCAVAYKNGGLACNCHGSTFTLAGAVQQGPATAPLAVYRAAVGADGITVTL